MTIEMYIAIALYVIMLVLIIFYRNYPVPWKKIWFYVKGGLLLIGFILLLNFVLVMFEKDRAVESLYSIWTYVYVVPVIIIVAYLDRPGKNNIPSNEKKNNLYPD